VKFLQLFRVFTTSIVMATGTSLIPFHCYCLENLCYRDTRSGFELPKGVYRLYTSALKYSNTVWEEVIAGTVKSWIHFMLSNLMMSLDIESKVKYLSEKGLERDYGWNLILWSSMTFQYTSYSGFIPILFK
jgi:hypothetical protein